MNTSSAILLLLALVATSVPAAETPAPVPFAPDIAMIQERGTLRVAQYHGQLKPFFFEEGPEKTRVGFDANLANHIASELKVEVEWNLTAQSYGELADILARGEADLAISCLSVTLDRQRKIFYSRPYLVMYLAMLINRLQEARFQGESEGGDLYDLCNRKNAVIGTTAGTWFVQVIKEQFPLATVKEYESMLTTINGETVELNAEDALLEGVRNGEVVGALLAEIDIRRYLRERPDLRLYARSAILENTEDRIGIGVCPKSPHLKEWIDLYLDQHHIDLRAGDMIDAFYPLESSDHALKDDGRPKPVLDLLLTPPKSLLEADEEPAGAETTPPASRPELAYVGVALLAAVFLLALLPLWPRA